MTNAIQIAEHALANLNRIIYEVPLRPATGSRFQPTGFPDLGAAVFTDPITGKEHMLVESAQSMANRLEAVCWDEQADDLVAPLKGLPYVRVTGDVATSSILEAHRLNSPYIMRADGFEEAFKAKAEMAKGSVDRKAFAKALFYYDPCSLVHGSFMSLIKPGTARLERMLSSFIEAHNVHIVASGGVKIDRNDVSGKDAGGSAAGFGNVPYHRNEYTAERIFVSFSLDIAGIVGLRLPDEAATLIVLLALYKMRAFLDGPKRLRTACDFDIANEPAQAQPESFALPERDALGKALASTIATCSKAGLIAAPAVTEVAYSAGKK